MKRNSFSTLVFCVDIPGNSEYVASSKHLKILQLELYKKYLTSIKWVPDNRKMNNSFSAVFMQHLSRKVALSNKL